MIDKILMVMFPIFPTGGGIEVQNGGGQPDRRQDQTDGDLPGQVQAIRGSPPGNWHSPATLPYHQREYRVSCINACKQTLDAGNSIWRSCQDRHTEFPASMRANKHLMQGLHSFIKRGLQVKVFTVGLSKID